MATTVEAELREQVAALMATQAESSRRIADLTREVDAKNRENEALNKAVIDLRNAAHAEPAAGDDESGPAASSRGPAPNASGGNATDDVDWTADPPVDGEEETRAEAAGLREKVAAVELQKQQVEAQLALAEAATRTAEEKAAALEVQHNDAQQDARALQVQLDAAHKKLKQREMELEEANATLATRSAADSTTHDAAPPSGPAQADNDNAAPAAADDATAAAPGGEDVPDTSSPDRGGDGATDATRDGKSPDVANTVDQKHVHEQQELAALREELAESKRALSDTSGALESEKDAHRSEHLRAASLDTRLGEVYQELATVEGQRSDAEKRAVAAEAANKELQEELDSIPKQPQPPSIAGQPIEGVEAMSVEEVAVLLRHDNICLGDENHALRQMVDTLVNDRASAKETIQHLVSQLEKLQAQVRSERDQQDSIATTKAKELESLYSGILLEKQDELDVCTAKLRMLEGTVADLQRSLLARAHVSPAPPPLPTATGRSSSASLGFGYDPSATAPPGVEVGGSVPKYHARGAATPAASPPPVTSSAAMMDDTRRAIAAGQKSAAVRPPASSSSSPPPPPRVYIPPELRTAIFGDV